jgi:hypothetical protein
MHCRVMRGGRTRFTRQRPQVRNLSRPPAQTASQPPPLGPLARRPPPGCGRPLASVARSDPLAGRPTVGRGPATAGVELAALEDPIALVQFRWGDRIRGLERERQPCVEPLETRTRVSPGRSWSMNCLWMGRSARAPLAVSVNTPVAAGALEGVDLELGVLVGGGDAGIAEQVSHVRDRRRTL